MIKKFGLLKKMKARNYLVISSLFSGYIFGSFILFRITKFWETNRSTKVQLLLACGLLLGSLFYFLYLSTMNFYIKNSTETNRIQVFLSFSISFLFLFTFLVGNEAQVPYSWLKGNGIIIEIFVNIIVAFFIFPKFIYSFLNLLFLIVRKICLRCKECSQYVNYQLFFCIMLLFISLGAGITSFAFKKSNDNEIIGSEKMVKSLSIIRYYLGDKLFQDALIGEGNWLVFSSDTSLDDYQNIQPFSEAQINKILKRIKELNNYLKSKGIKFILVIPPNKNTIYPEYLPSEIPIIGSSSRYDQLNSLFIQDESLAYIDLRQVLLDKRKSKVVYYATDTHWNPHGAYFAYEAIMQKIGEDFPEIEAFPLDHYIYERTQEKDGDVALRLVNINIQEDFYQLKSTVEYKLEVREINNRHKEYIIPNFNAPTLLVFNDSFGSGLAPFLREHFKYSIFIHGDDFDTFFIETKEPDIVILEWTERFLFRLLKLPNFDSDL